MLIALVVGTRPEFVQIEPLVKKIEEKGLRYIFIHSGQHYDYELNKIFFEEMELPLPTHYLGVGSRSPGEQIGEMLVKSEKIFKQEQPDILIASGDTNTTLALALAANKSKIKIGHIEAGMRSFDRSMPEEINRLLVDNISDYLFSPTQNGVNNLAKSGIRDNVFFSGDIMLESFLSHNHLIKNRPKILDELILDQCYVLLTIHRESNTDNKDRLSRIIKAISKIPYPIIFPIHPRTKGFLSKFNIVLPKNLFVIPPVGYFEFLRLANSSFKIVTDSGGIQKQAFFLSKPCVTLRANTEWIETIDGGWNILVDDNEKEILDAIDNFNPKGLSNTCPFGDGRTSDKILDIIEICDS